MIKEILHIAAVLISIWMFFSPPFFIEIIADQAPPGVAAFVLLAIVRMRIKKAIKVISLPAIILMATATVSIAQPYVDGHKRYSFAQTVLGIDMQYIPTGTLRSAATSADQAITSFESRAMLSPRFTISGLHFWGHADLFVTIPLGNILQQEQEGVKYDFTTNTETGFKIYPWRIESGKVRPYIGLSMNMVSFTQRFEEDDRGPYVNKMRTPLHAGFTFNHKNQLLEFGLSWYHQNEQQYPISPVQYTTLQTPPLAFSLGYKFYFDTSISAAPYEEAGYFEKKTKAMAAQNMLNGLSIGVGLSSAFVTARSEYNQDIRPFLGDHRAADIFLDFGLGYYLFQPDLHFNLAYRNIKAELKAYGVEQAITRRSFALEAFKFLGDYHGFVPFVGPVLSYEKLSASEWENNTAVFDQETQQIRGGIIFGWDIRPHRLQGLVLRTNLRYFPRLELDAAEGKTIRFDNLEFNFIQAVYYPGVAKRIRNFKVNL